MTTTTAHDFARQGNALALANLLQAGLSVDALDEKQNSLLMLAAYHGHTETVKLLLERGAQPDLRNAKGQTPLGGAAFKGYLEIAKLLLDAGADPQADQGGSTPADFAITFGRKEIVELLQNHSAAAAQPTRWYSRIIHQIR